MKTATKAFAERYIRQITEAEQAFRSPSTIIDQARWRQEVVPTLHNDRRAAIGVSIAVLAEKVRLAEMLEANRWQ